MDDNWRYPYFRPPNDSCTTIVCRPRRRRKCSSLRQVLFSPSAMTASFFSGRMRIVGQKPSDLSHVVMISSNQSFEFNRKCSAALFFSRTWHRFAKGDVETKRAVHLPHWVWGPEELVPRCPCLYYAYCISYHMYNMYRFLWIYPK